MKTLQKPALVSALLFISPLASAATYTGSWKNTTFTSSGALTINLTITPAKVTGSVNLDGQVFGIGNPPPIPFSAPLAANGSGSFNVPGTLIGDLAGSFTSNGTLSLGITNIPGSLTDAQINGKFNLTTEKFTGTYEVNSTGGTYAKGTAEAHVRKAPTLKVVGLVKVTGAIGAVVATVVTNTAVRSVKATASGNATVRVSGNYPNYRIEVRNLSGPTTNVRITVTNADGFQATKIVKFIKI